MTESPATADGLSDVDVYRMVRGQIEFEASLIAQRLSWFVAAQSFLFSAYAITLNAPNVAAMAEFREQQRLLYHLIPVVAVASCTLIYFAVLGGLFAQAHLRRFLARRLPGVRLAIFPPIQGDRSTHVAGLAAPLGMPMVFVTVWIYLFTRGFH